VLWGRASPCARAAWALTSIVTEIDPIKAIEALMDGFRLNVRCRRAAQIGDVFVTVTGNSNVMARDAFERLKNAHRRQLGPLQRRD